MHRAVAQGRAEGRAFSAATSFKRAGLARWGCFLCHPVTGPCLALNYV